jgi:hypothetical protein
MPDAPTVIGLVTQGLAEVKDAVAQLSRDLHGTLARMPTDYVPRREVERRLDEMTIDLGAERAAREAGDRALADAHQRAEDDRLKARRWLIGTSLATGMSAVGVAAGIFIHFT